MDPTPFFIMGLMVGVIATLLIQAYGRRRVRQALAGAAPDAGLALAPPHRAAATEIERMRARIAVLEQITTDSSTRTAREIDALR